MELTQGGADCRSLAINDLTDAGRVAHAAPPRRRRNGGALSISNSGSGSSPELQQLSSPAPALVLDATRTTRRCEDLLRTIRSTGFAGAGNLIRIVFIGGARCTRLIAARHISLPRSSCSPRDRLTRPRSDGARTTLPLLVRFSRVARRWPTQIPEFLTHDSGGSFGSVTSGGTDISSSDFGLRTKKQYRLPIKEASVCPQSPQKSARPPVVQTGGRAQDSRKPRRKRRPAS